MTIKTIADLEQESLEERAFLVIAATIAEARAALDANARSLGVVA